MSLKERLGNKIKQDEDLIEQEESPIEYYETNEIAQSINTLGVIEPLLKDSNLNAIYAYGAHNIYIERNGKINKTTLAYRDNIQFESIIRRLIKNSNIEIDEDNPVVKFKYKEGIVITASFAPISNPISVIIKCYRDRLAELSTMQKNQVFSKEISLFLEAISTANVNCAIIGDRNTYKTTLLSSIAKKIPLNDRGVIIDYSKEFELDCANIINYDFSYFTDEKIKNTLLNSLFSSNPNKILLNDCLEFNLFLPYLLRGYKGLIATMSVNCDELMKKQLKKDNLLDFFDILIYLKTQENGSKKIECIYEIKNRNYEKVFYLDEFNEYKSTGIIPDFCKNNSQLAQNMFDETYKHTYQNDKFKKTIVKFNKNKKADFLKKFKKNNVIKTLEIVEDERYGI